MSWSVVLLLLPGVPAGEEEKPAQFDNYTHAYRAAEQAKQPMLVILNPGTKAGEKPILLDEVRRDERCRELLDKYVVAVIDTGTRHGKTMHKLFGSEKLPRVVVIDKTQELQIYRSSEAMDGPQWKQVLAEHQSGEKPEAEEPEEACPS